MFHGEVSLTDRREAGMGKGLRDALVGVEANVILELRGPDGELKRREQVHNTVTVVGKAHMADQMSAVPDEAPMGWMALGTGAPGPLQLGTELDRNPLTSRTDALGVVTYVGNWAAGDATGALTEAGIFNNAGAGLGTMLVSAAFAVVNKGALDTLSITWTLTVN